MRLVIFGAAIVVVFTVFVTAFAAAADKTQVRVLPKTLWVLLCLLTSPIGGLLYIAIGRPVAAAGDDPNYLRNLADRLRDKGNNDR